MKASSGLCSLLLLSAFVVAAPAISQTAPVPDPHGPLRAAFADAFDGLGEEYARLGRYGEAEAEFRRFLILDPASWAGHYGLAVILYQTGDLSGAEQSARRALSRWRR